MFKAVATNAWGWSREVLASSENYANPEVRSIKVQFINATYVD